MRPARDWRNQGHSRSGGGGGKTDSRIVALSIMTVVVQLGKGSKNHCVFYVVPEDEKRRVFVSWF